MSDSYVVLARKWRPAQFADIVGQSHIVRTLTNAIRQQRIHQAYLFTGSRGIGKTSIARIFAKVLRCEATTETAEAIRSCDQCSSCREIAAGTSVDVIEIDGASNNGVEAIREIRENAKYLPASGSKKIYIIDEVHMLTTAAFNALLKTLEEPPAHVIFVFATTEPHKIPATILSRCQRFDYRRVTVAQIQGRLTQVAQAEGVKTEAGALALIARAAEGSMRDALSLLDQVIAFSGNQVTTQSVRDSIGLVGSQTVTAILAGILSRKPLDALKVVENAYEQGQDLRVLARHVIEFLHGVILAKVGAPRSVVLELSDDEWNELAGLSKLRELEELEMIFQAFHQGLEWIARSPQPKIVFDVIVVKCATAEALVYVDSAPSSAPKQSTPKTVAVSAPVSVSEPVTRPQTPDPIPQKKIPSGAKTFEDFISHVRTSKPLLASILEHGICLATPSESNPLLQIGFRPENTYFCEQLQARSYHLQLIALAKEVFGENARAEVLIRETAAAIHGHQEESLVEKREKTVRAQETSAKALALSHPLIVEAKSLFGGELGPIEVLNQEKNPTDA